MLNRLSSSVLALAFFVATADLSFAQSDARLATLGKLVQDDSPKVRVEALRALAKIPTAESAALALSALEKPMDPTLDYALWLTINDLAEPWIAALQSGAWKPEGREKQLEFALKALKPDQASRVFGQVLASRPLTKDGAGPWIELIGAAGSPQQLRQLFDQVLTGGFDDAAATRALKSLAEATRLRKMKPAGDNTTVGQLFDAASPAVRVEALRLAAAWKDLGGSFPKLAQLAGAPSSDPATRTAAFDALRAIGGSGAFEALTALTAADKDPVVRRQATAALAALDLGKALPAIVEVSKSLTDENAALEFWRAVLGVKGAGKQIAEALPDQGINPAAARAGMRVAREGGRNDLDLVVALAKGAGLAADTAAASAEFIKDFAAKAASKGDPYRGEWIYRRNDLACLSCHAIGGAGGKVGPDMTSIGASAPIDYLVESLLLPNAKIKEGYHSLIVTTKDGTEYTGTLARETPQEVFLRLASGTEQPIAKSDIEKREHGTLSLMPGGLLDPLNEQEQLDLFAFLSRLGKPGDFDAAQGGVARMWRITQTVHTDAQAGQELWPLTAPLDDKRWTPTYAVVKGVLPKGLVDEITKAQFWTSRLAIYAATEVTVAKAGPVHFQLTAGPGTELWVNGRKAGTTGESSVELPAGTHRVLVKLDPKQVPEVIRLESRDAAFALN